MQPAKKELCSFKGSKLVYTFVIINSCPPKRILRVCHTRDEFPLFKLFKYDNVIFSDYVSEVEEMKVCENLCVK